MTRCKNDSSIPHRAAEVVDYGLGPYPSRVVPFDEPIQHVVDVLVVDLGDLLLIAEPGERSAGSLIELIRVGGVGELRPVCFRSMDLNYSFGMDLLILVRCFISVTR
jgi:hypothetical protein